MKLLRGLHNLRPRHRGCVATIGNFDGVHLGHRAVLEQLHAQSRQMGLPAVVVLFEPQPQEFLVPARALPRLTRLGEKLALLREAGVDRVLCLRFDAQLAALSAEEFVERVLVEGLGVRRLVIGDDFRFGRGRQGDFALLERLGRRHGFDLLRAATYDLDGERVSSTRVREALARGDLRTAERLLGRPYAISGRVVRGLQNGRRIGYPTANIELRRPRVALRGILSAYIHGVAGEALPAVAYIGNRPVIDGERDLLEVHILDYEGDCYGRRVRVDFVQHLRGDLKFGSFDQLREQIHLDIRRARDSLALAAEFD